MAFSRVSMRKIREILRLHLQAGLKYRQIARSCSTTHATVGKYVEAAKQAGLDWPLPEELADDETLIARLFPASVSTTEPSRPDEASFGSGSNKHNPVLRDEGRDGLRRELETRRQALRVSSRTQTRGRLTMLYEIIDAPTLPRGLRPGDQRDWQRPVVSAMAEQTGIPAHRFLHPVGRGEHYSRRADFDEADAFYSDSYQLHEPPSIEAPASLPEPDHRSRERTEKGRRGPEVCAGRSL